MESVTDDVKAAHLAWEKMTGRLAKDIRLQVQKLILIKNDPVELLQLFSDTHRLIHRTKGLAGACSFKEARPWYEKIEEQYIRLKTIINPLLGVDLYSELLSSTEKATIIFSKAPLKEPYSISVDEPLPKIPNPELILRSHHSSSEMIKWLNENGNHIPWKNELVQRLDSYKINLMFSAKQLKWDLFGCSIKMVLNDIRVLQKLDNNDSEEILLDVWPQVDVESVQVRILWMFLSEKKTADIQKIFPKELTWYNPT